MLRAMKERLFARSAFDEFRKAFTEEMNRLRREHRVQVTAAPREIAAINRRSDEILELLLRGFSDDGGRTSCTRSKTAGPNSTPLSRRRRSRLRCRRSTRT